MPHSLFNAVLSPPACSTHLSRRKHATRLRGSYDLLRGYARNSRLQGDPCVYSGAGGRERVERHGSYPATRRYRTRCNMQQGFQDPRRYLVSDRSISQGNDAALAPCHPKVRVHHQPTSVTLGRAQLGPQQLNLQGQHAGLSACVGFPSEPTMCSWEGPGLGGSAA